MPDSNKDCTLDFKLDVLLICLVFELLSHHFFTQLPKSLCFNATGSPRFDCVRLHICDVRVL